jgi:hypothetical protein|tara:strand:- start:679 stop:1140 length:462 start_codon:yes stop_codon:yes gene_type:complete
MSTDKIKTSRASQTRVKETKKQVWTPPSSLDAPPAPDGYHHRWIRAETMGFDDTKNMSAMLRSGYELVRADQYPDTEYPAINDGKYKGVIGVGGLVLARISLELVQSRKEYFDKLTKEKDEAIKNDLMKEQHPGMPIDIDRQSRVTFGGTKKD